MCSCARFKLERKEKKWSEKVKNEEEKYELHQEGEGGEGACFGLSFIHSTLTRSESFRYQITVCAITICNRMSFFFFCLKEIYNIPTT